MFRTEGQGRPGSFFLLLLVVGALLIGMHLGRRVAEQDASAVVAEPPEIAALEKSLKEARAELDMSTTRHEVDRQALQMVRAELATQKDEIAALEEDLRFYRGLMAPESTTAVISLVAPEISFNATPGAFGYRFVVLQRARKHEWAKGMFEAAIAGTGIDGPVSYPLGELSDSVEEESVELGFRYFQAIEGVLALPEGFQPLAIDVTARIQKPQKLELEERYPWPFEE